MFLFNTSTLLSEIRDCPESSTSLKGVNDVLPNFLHFSPECNTIR